MNNPNDDDFFLFVSVLVSDCWEFFIPSYQLCVTVIHCYSTKNNRLLPPKTSKTTYF